MIAELREVQHDEKAVSDRFYRHLAFGTGGLRGVHCNPYLVRRSHFSCRNGPCTRE